MKGDLNKLLEQEEVNKEIWEFIYNACDANFLAFWITERFSENDQVWSESS